MSAMHEHYVQLYNAIGEPFDRVREVLAARSLRSLEAPRRLAMDWLHEGEARLEVELAGLHLMKEVCFRVSYYMDVPGRLPMGRLQLSWESVEHADVYPIVTADLEIEPIDNNRTMVSLLASYDPPLGRLGAIVDRVAMHRVAEAALGRFFTDLVRDLRAAARVEST
jgi:hypothetical protein